MHTPNPYNNPVDPMTQPNTRVPVNAQGTDELKTLNGLLKGELAACETYAQAMSKVEDSPELFTTLTNCRMSHESRCRKLSQRIIELGGEPVTSSGAWGAFAKFIEGGAKIFGDKTAIAALEEGEDKGLQDYNDAILRCTGTTAQLLQLDLMPEQERTHAVMSQLKKSL